MTHRKHIRKPQGELVATTASPKEKQTKCQKAYNNRKGFKKEYVNVPTTLTIGNMATTDALRKLRQFMLKGVGIMMLLFVETDSLKGSPAESLLTFF